MNSQGEQVFRFNQVFFQKKATKNYQETLSEFKKITKSFAIFNIGFFSLFFIEIVLFASLFAYLTSSTLLAIVLASIFLTCFSYFVLLFYFQSKKADQIVNLKDRFIKICRRALSLPFGCAEHHLTVAHAALKLTEKLSELEKEDFKKLNFLIKKVILYFQKEDLFKFREKLLIAAAKEHIKQLQYTPTDLEVHASLSNIYTNLSKLYLDSMKLFSSKTTRSEIEQKHNATIKSTIEEFKILNDYAPNDPWVHLQLAKSYNKLNMQTSEAKEYETIYKLCPNDSKILFRLGVLYFEMGKNSKGLRVYEELKIRSYKKADSLLSFYGIFKTQEIYEDSL